MQDSFIRSERHYLYQESKEFVDAFPQVSRYLSDLSADPDINRTLDGFTYLCALLNAKLEKEYPQLTAGLMNMLWPNYLQPTPSMTMLQFKNSTNRTIDVPASATVLSREKHDADVQCKFTLTRDIHVSPFNITSITQNINNQEIVINFEATEPVFLTKNEFNALRLYCGSDLHSGYLIYLWLAEYLEEATLLVNDSEYSLRDLSFEPIGFKDINAMFIYPKNTFSGYRLLHEYFCYPEGYLFCDINGIPDYFNKISTNKFSLRLTFQKPLPNTIRLHDELIKTNCAPVRNIFYYDCEPIILSGQRTEYPLAIDYKNKDFYELFAINQVTGWFKDHYRDYALFDGFHHQVTYNKKQPSYYYYVNRYQEANDDQINYTLSFVRDDETIVHGQDEIISIKALCSNGDQAQSLRIGDINVAGDDIPIGVSFSNIACPTKAMRPTLNASLQWTTISSLALNYHSLLNAKSLNQILQNYNFTTLYSHRAEKSLIKLLHSIVGFETNWISYPYEDLKVTGYESTIYIEPSAFNNDGEMYLFGSVIAHFYSQYAAVNSFHFLKLVNSLTSEVYQWKLMNI